MRAYKQRSDAHLCSVHIEDVLTGTEATLWAQISKQLSGVHRGRRPTPANKDGTEEPPHQKEEKGKIPQYGSKKKEAFSKPPLHLHYKLSTCEIRSAHNFHTTIYFQPSCTDCCGITLQRFKNLPLVGF